MGLSVRTFGMMRMAVGGSSWLTPKATGRFFGLGEGQPLVTRLFGVRDTALGAALLDPNPVHQHRALQAGLACDAVDVVATVLAVRKGDIGVHGALLVGGGAVLFATLGFLTLRQHDAEADAR